MNAQTNINQAAIPQWPARVQALPLALLLGFVLLIGLVIVNRDQIAELPAIYGP